MFVKFSRVSDVDEERQYTTVIEADEVAYRVLPLPGRVYSEDEAERTVVFEEPDDYKSDQYIELLATERLPSGCARNRLYIAAFHVPYWVNLFLMNADGKTIDHVCV